MDKKAIYRSLSAEFPLFMKDWWLDAVCGEDSWSPLLCFDKNQKVAAASFVYNKNRGGFRTITQPILTPFSGVWIRPLPADAAHTFTKHETEILAQIATLLPDVWHLGINLQYKLQNVLPFHWQGFKQTMRYTHLLDLNRPILEISKDYNMGTRQRIRHANDYQLDVLDDLDILFQQYALSLKTVKPSFDTAKLQNIITANRQNVAGEAFCLRKKGENTVLCTAFVAWDNETAYLCMMGNSKINADAPTIMVHLLIADCQSRGLKIFDFEGSMLSAIEQFYRSFGATKQPYHRITKSKNKFLHRLL